MRLNSVHKNVTYYKDCLRAIFKEDFDYKKRKLEREHINVTSFIFKGKKTGVDICIQYINHVVGTCILDKFIILDYSEEIRSEKDLMLALNDKFVKMGEICYHCNENVIDGERHIVDDKLYCSDCYIEKFIIDTPMIG